MPAYMNSFGLNPATNGPNSFYDATVHHNWHATSDGTSNYVQREVMTFCNDDLHTSLNS
jgi:hypothetical protein